MYIMNVAVPLNKLRKAICMGESGGNHLVHRECTVCFPQKPTKEVEKNRLGVVGQINEQYILKFELKI